MLFLNVSSYPWEVAPLRQKICDYESLSELSAKEFILEKDAFLIYFRQHCYAYENSCPHTRVNLNWQEEQFFSFDGLFLQCSLHGALFDPTSGVCVRGPCVGEKLKKINLVIEKGIVYADE